MNKVKFLLVLAFLVVLAAGAVVGMAIDRRLRAAVTTPVVQPHRGPWNDLSLTPEQQAKWRDIWSEVYKLRDDRFRTRRQLSQKREQEIQQFQQSLTSEQRTQYESIQKEYKEDVDAVEKRLADAVRNAEDQTRAMLTPEQQAKFEKMRERFGIPGGRRGGQRGERGRPFSSPTTRPAPESVQ
jgi:Spy/CpxP family protein refolding chaperone